MSTDALLDGLLADLAAETDALRAVVADLPDDPADGARTPRTGWATPTPAPGWTVAHQVAHLAWTDRAATLAATDEGGWDALVLGALEDPEGFVDRGAEELAALPTAELLATWDDGRVALADALRGVPAGRRMPWFGPPMSAASMATARFMETWAHALDVRDGLGVVVEPTDRVRHVCHLGVRTRDFAYATHGLTPPAAPFHVELVAPSGERWTWGPEDATDQVRGSAWDLARLVTQRVHRDDTDLVATGAEADRWLGIAQCFAGPPGEGRGSARG